MTPAVSVRDAFVVYDSPAGGTAALQGLTFDVQTGEIVVILGPSGSGKTTLLRVVAGFERLSAGSVDVLGTDVARLDARAADVYRATELGLLDQHYARSLSPDLTCGQTVSLQLELLGRDVTKSRAVASGLLDRVGLANRVDDLPGSLSGGEQQRVAVCAAVAHGPGLLLADEPAGELDADNAQTVYALLGSLVRETGATALIVSHDDAATAIADRIVHVRDGRIVEEARPGETPSLVVARGGWVRLPEPLVRELGSPRHLDVGASPGGLVLTPSGVQDARLESVAASERAPAGDGEVVARLERASKRFGTGHETRAVFAELDVSFRSGRFTAVVGRSGTGKTTLLHLLAGLERPTDGDVELLGLALGGRTRTELATLRREAVALVTQEPGLVPYLSALENVELGLQLRGAEEPELAQARRALMTVGLEDRLHTAASRLSAGERQRVAIARALAADVRLLLVDEPTARLDEENAREVAGLLARAAHENGLAVVCATHDRALVDLADDVVRLGASARIAA
jgi:ABC-type lipoprotein export system ATPase subunit